MKRFFATVVLALAAGGVLAAPVPPAEARKPAAFPAGHYVLCGAPEAARGGDVFEITTAFRPRTGHYVLSGGPKPTDTLLVDDDLTVSQGDTALFVDDDGVQSTRLRGKAAARYQGWPLLLVLDPSKKVRLVVTDFGDEAALSALWLHRWDGARKKLTDGTSAASSATLPHKFFDDSFSLVDGFEMPEGVKHEAPLDLPAKPALLLPRFKGKGQP
jgi:hypothetical protein